MSEVTRYDRVKLRPARRMDNGMLRVDATLTRTGVFTYRDAKTGKVTREYRPPEEVFDAVSLESFDAVPVTNDHPPVMLNAENATTYARGTVTNVRRDGNEMVGTLTITDAGLIRDIEGGKQEISNGYRCHLDATPGISPDGEVYDAVQRKIGGNHVAVVTAGRAGTARIRLDGASQFIAEDDRMTLDEALKEIGRLTAENKAATARADAAEQATEAERGKREGAEKALAAEQKARTDAADGFDAAVQARAALLATVAPVLGDKFDAKASDDAMMRAVVEAVDGDKLDAKASTAYVQGRYDSAIKRANITTEKLAPVRGAGAGSPADKVDAEDVGAARERMYQRLDNPTNTDDEEA